MEETETDSSVLNNGAGQTTDGCGLSDLFLRRRKNSDDDNSKIEAETGWQWQPAGPNGKNVDEKSADHLLADNVEGDSVDVQVHILSEYEKCPQYSYNMKHLRRGKMTIVSNRDFLESSGMAEFTRFGTEVDVGRLKTAFYQLGFECVVYENQTCAQMLNIFITASNDADTDVDCMAFAILSHGEENGMIYGIDDAIPLDSLLSPLKHGANMDKFAGKPKLIFVQACRGTQIDEGIDVYDSTDGCEKTGKCYRIPIEADFLYTYCTAPGYYAFRSTQSGSIFIRCLCDLLQRLWRSLDLLQILTRVNSEVAFHFQSAISENHPDYMALNKRKQMPCIVSTLTKDVYFLPKPKKVTTV